MTMDGDQQEWAELFRQFGRQLEPRVKGKVAEDEDDSGHQDDKRLLGKARVSVKQLLKQLKGRPGKELELRYNLPRSRLLRMVGRADKDGDKHIGGQLTECSMVPHQMRRSGWLCTRVREARADSPHPSRCLKKC